MISEIEFQAQPLFRSICTMTKRSGPIPEPLTGPAAIYWQFDFPVLDAFADFFGRNAADCNGYVNSAPLCSERSRYVKSP